MAIKPKTIQITAIGIELIIGMVYGVFGDAFCPNLVTTFLLATMYKSGGMTKVIKKPNKPTYLRTFTNGLD